MANEVRFLSDRFIAFSGTGMIQVDKDTPLADADIDTRHKCSITLEDAITRRDLRDCEDVDLTGQPILTRVRRVRLTYPSITPQLLAFWLAYYLGGAAAPTGSPQNEIQTLSRSGTVNAGFFTLSLTLEGRTATTTPIAWDATATEIEDALTAARMKWIQPGDVSISGGTKQVETLVMVGTSSGGNLPVTVKAANLPALAGAGKTINVALANLDDPSASAVKVRAALAADSDIGSFFTFSGAGANVIGTARTAAANDTTMEISNTAAVGMSAATSANTTPGVSAESWGALGMIITFQNRLAHANLAQLVVDNSPAGSTPIGGGGTVINTNVQDGAQHFHEFTRSDSREKVLFGFAIGYLTGSDDPVKYSSFACESLTPSINRRNNVTLEVSIIGSFEGTPMTGYSIPDCINPDPLLSEDCKIIVNSNWETTDVSSVAIPLNDNVPLDDSAYGFDGIDPDLLARAKQVIYSSNATIFATENDAISLLAENERTQDPVDVKYHFGQPGNRTTILAPMSKIKFQTNRFTAVGAAERLAGNFELTAFKNDQDPPISAEAYIDQSVVFLDDGV